MKTYIVKLIGEKEQRIEADELQHADGLFRFMQNGQEIRTIYSTALECPPTEHIDEPDTGEWDRFVAQGDSLYSQDQS